MLKTCLLETVSRLSYVDNPIPISLCFFESEPPFKQILSNQQGQPIIKGNSEATLFKGKCTFKKIYLRDVSSHYPNGCLIGVILPKQPSFDYATQQDKS